MVSHSLNIAYSDGSSRMAALRSSGKTANASFIAAGEGRTRRVVGGRSNEQHGAPLTLIVESPAAAKDAFAVLPQDLRVTVRVRDVQRMRHHL